MLSSWSKESGGYPGCGIPPANRGNPISTWSTFFRQTRKLYCLSCVHFMKSLWNSIKRKSCGWNLTEISLLILINGRFHGRWYVLPWRDEERMYLSATNSRTIARSLKSWSCGKSFPITNNPWRQNVKRELGVWSVGIVMRCISLLCCRIMPPSSICCCKGLSSVCNYFE